MLHFLPLTSLSPINYFIKQGESYSLLSPRYLKLHQKKTCMEGDPYIIACHALTSKTIVKDSHSLTRERLSRSFLHY